MHISVLQEPFLELFRNKTVSTFVDGTLGAAGHSLVLAKEHPELQLLVGFDQDSSALEIAEEKLGTLPKLLIHSNFSHLLEQLHAHSITQVDGIILDLGVSSMQLDQAARGFSLQQDGPLDMRMDRSQSLTAEEIIHTYSQEELANIFYNYGEERRSRIVAKVIFEQRRKMRIDTTDKLVKLLSTVLFRTGKTHPATKVFQALRIAVNQELTVLETVLPQAVKLLSPGGILVVISFHSLEDRIVKNAFRDLAKGDSEFQILTKKPIVASRDECRQNPRSRSAKMRAIMHA
jgi:16S rRNA (cytosine1402-N4)-methyltransferase